MCGIFGYIGTRSHAADMVLKGIKTLEYRGYDSWGVGVIPTDGVKQIKIKKQVGKIGSATVHELPPSSLGFGHTRWATHGGVTQKNAHPHTDCTGTIALIHNGIIENYDTLKKQFKTPHTIISETDSEIAAHLIEESLKTLSFQESVRQTFLQCAGSNAFVVIHKNERCIIAICNGSPLVVGYGKHEQFIASDAAGLLPYTKKVHFLEDNEMAVLTDNAVTIYDARSGNTIPVNPTTLTWTTKAMEKNAYATFMEKEISEQPEMLDRLLTQDADIQKLTAAIHASKGAYLIGCGSAYYACLAGTYLFSTIAKRHINATVASEFTYQEDFINDKSLVIALSQSGETMDLIDAVKRAKTKGAKIASIVNVEGSTLWRLSDLPIPCGAGPEISVASTKDLIAKLAHLISVSYSLAQQPSERSTVLNKAVLEIRRIIEQKQAIMQLTTSLIKKDHIFIVGRGLSYPAALEIAMKIKEISYIHAEGLAAGELKHGTLALVEKGTPCIVIAPNDETHGANIAAAMELKARGALIIGISNVNHEVFDHYIEVKDCGPATILPTIVVGQLLALGIATKKGLDPDKPRNLAKSVTVK
jgi:glucosamine--fructose-6-phosphate aminotransferase (isomerizing)